MAEITIMNTAKLFTVDSSAMNPWICRDDNGDYWAVVRTVSDTVNVYKSINSGATWNLKKSLSNSDFTSTPFPTNYMHILNLAGNDMVYLYIEDKSDLLKHYGWIFNVTADTNLRDIDGISFDGASVSRYQVSWNAFDSQLQAVTRGASNEGRFFLLDLAGGGTWKSTGGSPQTPVDYACNPNEGYGYVLGHGSDLKVVKYQRGASFNTVLMTRSLTAPAYQLGWANVVFDASDNPVIGYYRLDTGNLYYYRLDKTNLGTTLASASIGLGPPHPSSFWMTIDAADDVYFIYTDETDGETYVKKYDGSWQAAVKISSDNDGKLVSCERQPGILDTQILLTYQATA